MRVEGFSKIIASTLPASGPLLADLALAAARLEGGARLEHAAKLGAGEVREVEEMALAVDHSAAPRRASARISLLERLAGAHRAGRPPRRSRPRRRSAAAGAARRCRRPGRSAASAPRAASTKSVFGDVACAARASGPRRGSRRSPPGWRSISSASRCFRSRLICADVLEEARLEHDVEHGVADRHGERVAAEGRAVGAGRHALGGLGASRGRRPSGSRRRCPWRSP